MEMLKVSDYIPIRMGKTALMYFGWRVIFVMDSSSIAMQNYNEQED